MAGGIVWLASYPKSGSTWVRAFLAAYLADGEPLSFDRLQAVTASDSRWKNFVPVAGKPPHQLSDAEVDALRPEVQRRLAKTAQPMRVVKTHNARIIAHGTPLVQPQHTRAAIYVVRNPLDIVDSLSDHAGLTVDATIALLNGVPSASVKNLRCQGRGWVGGGAKGGGQRQATAGMSCSR